MKFYLMTFVLELYFSLNIADILLAETVLYAVQLYTKVYHTTWMDLICSGLVWSGAFSLFSSSVLSQGLVDTRAEY